MIAILIRSFIFNVYFYSFMIYMLTVYRFVNKERLFNKFINWSKLQLKMLQLICNIDYKLENYYKYTTPVIYAVKHESAWETISLIYILNPSIYVLKQELIKIPLFGKFLKTLDMISIDRSAGISAIKELSQKSKNIVLKNQSIIIFPEGTRTKPGELGNISSSGLYVLYKTNNIPVIPVFINSGTFWPRKSFLKKPGTIIVSFLGEIPPGLGKSEFSQKIETMFKSKMREFYEKDYK